MSPHNFEEVGFVTHPQEENTMTAIGIAYGCIAAGYTIGAIGYIILIITHG